MWAVLLISSGCSDLKGVYLCQIITPLRLITLTGLCVKLSPVNMWGCFADCCREALSPVAGDGFNTVVARSREFDTVVNAFTFYNCNAETGRYPAFYVKGV